MDDVDAQKRRVASLYDRVATEYDQMGPSIFAAIGERVVALANLSPGERVLDVACGRGANLFPAAQRVGPSGRAVGVDIAANMVHLTADDALRRGFSNVTTLLMDAERLEFADATFDMCFCSFAYFFFPHPDQAFAEIARVLTPEGRFLVTAHGGTESPRTGELTLRGNGTMTRSSRCTRATAFPGRRVAAWAILARQR